SEGGVGGTGDEDIPNYPAANSGGEGEYESTKETVNYELNHIHNDIVQAPYKLRDLGIQVAVDNVKQIDGDDVQLLDNAEQNDVEDGMHSILDSLIKNMERLIRMKRSLLYFKHLITKILSQMKHLLQFLYGHTLLEHYYC